MKDKTFSIVLSIVIGIILISLFWYGCEQRNKREEEKKGAIRYQEEHPFEKYVYLDTAGVLHRERNCFNLFINAVQYYDTTYGFGRIPNGYCTSCFSTNQYELFQKIESRARKRKLQQ